MCVISLRGNIDAFYSCISLLLENVQDHPNVSAFSSCNIQWEETWASGKRAGGTTTDHFKDWLSSKLSLYECCTLGSQLRLDLLCYLILLSVSASSIHLLNCLSWARPSMPCSGGGQIANLFLESSPICPLPCVSMCLSVYITVFASWLNCCKRSHKVAVGFRLIWLHCDFCVLSVCRSTCAS